MNWGLHKVRTNCTIRHAHQWMIDQRNLVFRSFDLTKSLFKTCSWFMSALQKAVALVRLETKPCSGVHRFLRRRYASTSTTVTNGLPPLSLAHSSWFKLEDQGMVSCCSVLLSFWKLNWEEITRGRRLLKTLFAMIYSEFRDFSLNCCIDYWSSRPITNYLRTDLRF